MNKIFIFALTLIFFAANVFAQANLNSSSAFEWLDNAMISSNWNKDVDEIAMSILALRNGGYDTSDGIDKLKALENIDNWGDVRDTAYAVLALYKSGENVDAEVEWLREEERLGDNGEWLVQIRAEGNGTCRMDYSNGESEIKIEDGDVTCRDEGLGSMFNLENCIQRSLQAFENFEIECAGINPSGISLLYNNNNIYFLLSEDSPLEVKDACYDGCRYLDAALTSWVFYEIGEEDHSELYLDINRDESVVGHSVLSLLSDENQYEEWLINSQELSGSWNRDIFNTAFAYRVLENSLNGKDSSDSAKQWLGEQQDDDGSFNHDVFDTAFVLFALTPEVGPAGPRCGDGVCSTNLETLELCPQDCAECGDGRITSPEVCEFNSDCAVNEECSDDCLQCVPINTTPTGCTTDDECMANYQCGTGEVCDTSICACVPSTNGGGEGEGEGGAGSNRGNESGGNTLIWLFIITGVVVVLAGTYFYLKRKGGRGPGKRGGPRTFEDFLKSKPSSPPLTKSGLPRQYSYPRSGSSYSAKDKELDESIRKAKGLIGKK